MPVTANTCFLCRSLIAGARALRQLLPPVHQLSEGQDAHRSGDRRPGEHETAGDGQRPRRRSAEHRGQHEPHRRSEHAGRREYLTIVNVLLSARRDHPPSPSPQSPSCHRQYHPIATEPKPKPKSPAAAVEQHHPK